MDGFLNVNKPLGITSFDVIRTLNRIQPGVKMGHLGTLDPMATGVLPIALGKATRLIEYIDNRIKVYAARMVLGGISDTQDATGNITWLDSDPAEPEQIIQTAKSFIGVIQQIPPMYSAVHYQGQRLYQLARKGITVEVNPRQVEIYSLDITDISSNESGLIQVSFKVKCSEGTYIRTLCHDMGQKLATGAYMDKLIRVCSGVFRIEESYTPETIMTIGLKSCLKPLDYPINKFPAMQLSEENYNRVCNGN
ncbi:MAG TPA: tRNA pseudouridine(55) synthase TruB, partial [Syntrophomonadaceae bacterium]|nr:tRNA pseudouridine(55) synthase TruB [Syntrophomonadaceae bacterium]